MNQVHDQTLFDFVPASRMFVAPYGRPISRPKVDTILASWNEKALGNLYLSFRYDTNTYAILDGAHRRQAAIEKGLEVLPCRIFIDLSYEEEARLYVAFATVNVQSFTDKFRARLEAKEPRALSIRNILQDHNLAIDWTNHTPEGTPAGARVHSLTRVEGMYARQGSQFLGEVLNVLWLAWGAEHHRAWGTKLLSGMELFWSRYRDVVDTRRLVEKLNAVTPEHIITMASALRQQAEGILNVPMHTAGTPIGLAIMQLYNQGLRTPQHLPAWPSHVVREENRERVAATARRNLARGRTKRGG